jgi:hypothetical protein
LATGAVNCSLFVYFSNLQLKWNTNALKYTTKYSAPILPGWFTMTEYQSYFEKIFMELRGGVEKNMRILFISKGKIQAKLGQLVSIKREMQYVMLFILKNCLEQ